MKPKPHTEIAQKLSTFLTPEQAAKMCDFFTLPKGTEFEPNLFKYEIIFDAANDGEFIYFLLGWLILNGRGQKPEKLQK